MFAKPESAYLPTIATALVSKFFDKEYENELLYMVLGERCNLFQKSPKILQLTYSETDIKSELKKISDIPDDEINDMSFDKSIQMIFESIKSFDVSTFKEYIREDDNICVTTDLLYMMYGTEQDKQDILKISKVLHYIKYITNTYGRDLSDELLSRIKMVRIDHSIDILTKITIGRRFDELMKDVDIRLLEKHKIFKKQDEHLL